MKKLKSENSIENLNGHTFTVEEKLEIYEKAIEELKDIVLLFDLEGNIIYANEKALKEYGYSQQEILSMNMCEIRNKSNKEIFENQIEEAMKEGIQFQAIHTRKDGSSFHVEVKSIAVEIETTKVILSDIRDVSRWVEKNKELGLKYEELSAVYEELMATEEDLRTNYVELQVAKKEVDKVNEVKNQFFANMSHEIRTPLNRISGLIELLNLTELNHEQKEYIEYLKASSRALLNIADNIIDISKIETGQSNVNKINFYLKNTVDKIIKKLSIACNKKKLKLSYYVDPNIPFDIIGDELILNQIIINLMSNAIKFTEKGQIIFEVKKVSQIGDKIKLQFSVEDTGIGIENIIKEQIFKKYVQNDSILKNQYKSTGIGLAISKELVTMLNGDIWFESKVNIGSKFYFTAEFQLNNSEIIIDNNDSFNGKINTKNNKVVLIAEDNKINMKIISAIVHKMGHEYFIANDGMEAVKILEQNKIDLVLIDIQVPVLNGYEVTRIVRESEARSKIYEHKPIIAMTQYAMVGDRELLLENGMDDYISKPFDKSKLEELITKYLQY